MGGIFQNKVFYLFGRFETPRRELYESIEAEGGKIQHDIEGEAVPDYCIVQEYANSLNEYIKKAMDADIPILKQTFIVDSIKNTEIEDLEAHMVEPRPSERRGNSDRRDGFRGARGRGGRGGRGRGDFGNRGPRDSRGGSFSRGDSRGDGNGEEGRGGRGFRGDFGGKRSRDYDSNRPDMKRRRFDEEEGFRGGRSHYNRSSRDAERSE